MRILERWKKTLDKGGYICAIFMDLSKAFDSGSIAQNYSKIVPFHKTSTAGN